MRPDETASRIRRSQPLSWANMRTVSSTSRLSTVPMLSPRSTKSSMAERTTAMAASRRSISRSAFSAIKVFTTMRGSWSTTWPRPMPSASAMPRARTGRRAAVPASGASPSSSPEAIISESTMAVVWSASISSSE